MVWFYLDLGTRETEVHIFKNLKYTWNLILRFLSMSHCLQLIMTISSPFFLPLVIIIIYYTSLLYDYTLNYNSIILLYATMLARQTLYAQTLKHHTVHTATRTATAYTYIRIPNGSCKSWGHGPFEMTISHAYIICTWQLQPEWAGWRVGGKILWLFRGCRWSRVRAKRLQRGKRREV